MDMNPIHYFEYSSTGCEVIGKLVANYFNEGGLRNVPYGDLIDFYYQSETFTNFSPGAILDSYDGWLDTLAENKDGNGPEKLYEIVRVAADNCTKHFCQNIRFSGNPDLAGVGVLVAFAFQLSMASLFSVFAIYCYSITRDQKMKRMVFCGVFHTFFTSSVYFNIALAVAVVVTIAIDDKTQYTAVVANLNLLMSLGSTQALWPLFVLYLNFRRRESNGKLTPGSLFKLQLLKASLGLLGATLLSTCAATVLVNWGSTFELFCFNALPARSIASGLLYVPIGIAALGLSLAGLRQWYPSSWPLAKVLCASGSNKSTTPRWLYMFVVLLGLVIMWVAFGVLWMLRMEMFAFTGDAYEENKWGFGQIVAVVAWLPTLVHIVWETVEHLFGWFYLCIVLCPSFPQKGENGRA